MREYIFDVAMMIVGSASMLACWWLLTHLSDWRVIRWFRPRDYLRYTKPTTDDVRTERTAMTACVAVFLLILGTLLLMSGVLRLFGFGRG
ncbi:MAG TPA: hypothetical protein VJU84_21710 [Pyrinomonadaceae bacterium]|nr:hypothetical protein [Pyrinomonadaceae bacterium]